jgi:hypothetical protein
VKNSDVAQKEMTQNSTITYAHRKVPLHSNSRRGAHRTPTRRAASIVSFFFGLAILIVLLAQEARAESDKVWNALANCRWQPSAIVLNHDGTVLCFDGPIESNLDLSVFRDLKAGGYVVMRSPGGHARTAMLLSDMLREKDALVILYDYCLSACANYVLVANRTFVRKGTIVAWHGGLDSVLGLVTTPWCHRAGLKQRPQEYFDDNGAHTENRVDRWCEWDDRYIHAPQTHYTKMKVRSALMKETDKNNVYWMWNPKNYGDHFKLRVSFDSYPRSQYEVDSIVARHRLGIRIVFDP